MLGDWRGVSEGCRRPAFSDLSVDGVKISMFRVLTFGCIKQLDHCAAEFADS